jgi:hypothetical protein
VANTKIEETGNFEVIDETGRTHIITILTRFTEHVPMSGIRQWVPGSRLHKMENGNPVNVNDDGTVEDVLGSRTLRRT